MSKVEEEKKKKELYADKHGGYSRRERFHFWLCDRLGIVPSDDFDELFGLVDDLGVHVFRYCKSADKAWKAQDEFNHLVAQKIGLDKKTDDDVERGVL